MFVYLFLLIGVLFVFQLLSRIVGNGWALFVVWLIMSLFAGFRDYGVGTDTTFYSEAYMIEAQNLNIKDFFLQNTDGVRDRGYLALNWFASCMSDDYWLIWFLTEALILLSTILAFRKLGQKYVLSIPLCIVVYFFLFYQMSFNLMRQMCAVSVSLLAYMYALEKQWTKYVLLTFLAVSFHSSATLSVCFPFLCMFSEIENERKRRLFYFITIGGLIALVLSFNFILAKFGDIFNEAYADRYGEGNELGASSGIPIKNIVNIIIMLYLWWLSCKKECLQLKERNILLYCISFYGILMFMSLYSRYLFRLYLYFYPMAIMLLSVVCSSRKVSVIYKFIFVLYSGLYWYYFYMKANFGETAVYSSKILGISPW